MKNEFLHTSKKVNAEAKQYFTRHKIAAIGSAAILAVAGIGKASWEYLNKSGEHVLYQPANPEYETIDNHFNVASWNMHNETSFRGYEIKDIAEKADLDVFALQEVNADDVKNLASTLDGWYVTYALADKKQQTLDGGYGDVLITKQKPKDIVTKSISGTSLFKSILGAAEGLVVDVANANTSFHQTKQGIQESRVAVAETIKVIDGDEQKDIRVITSHISGVDKVGYIFGEDPIETVQRQELGKFIVSQLKAGRPTQIEGDFNATPDIIIPWLEKMGFEVLHTGHTSTNSPRTIDYIALNSDGIEHPIKYQSAAVLEAHHTDHYAITAKFILDLPSQISMHYPKPPNQMSQKLDELTLHFRQSSKHGNKTTFVDFMHK